MTWDTIINYLNEKWETKSSEKFKVRLIRRLRLISSFPKLHSAAKVNPKYRRSMLGKQVSIIYIIDKNRITIVRLLDNRSKPSV